MKGSQPIFSWGSCEIQLFQVLTPRPWTFRYKQRALDAGHRAEVCMGCDPSHISGRPKRAEDLAVVLLRDCHGEEGNTDTELDGRWAPASVAGVTLLQHSALPQPAVPLLHIPLHFRAQGGTDLLFPQLPPKKGLKIRTTFIRQASNPGQR